jgi:hypothetical protein
MFIPEAIYLYNQNVEDQYFRIWPSKTENFLIYIMGMRYCDHLSPLCRLIASIFPA